jgi:hypothetical protein
MLTALRSFLARQASSMASRFPFFLTFLFLGTLWALSFWPALHDAWYVYDDYLYCRTPSSFNWANACSMGRPVFWLWTYTYQLDADPNNVWTNILLRWMQGGFHVLTGTLLAYLLWKQLRSWTAILAVLPFVLWSFNAEAVLWRGAGINVLAPLFSVLGVVLICIEGWRGSFWRWCGNVLVWSSGVALVILSMLTTQAAANAGLAAWLLVVAITAFRSREFMLRRTVREGLFLASGYLLGGLLSWYIARSSPSTDVRVNFTFDWRTKLDFLVEMNKLYLFLPPYYPRSLKIAHVAMCLGAALLAIMGLTRLSRYGIEMPWALVVGLSCLAACVVAPYASNLVVYHHFPCYRNLYSSPLLITGCVATAFCFARRMCLKLVVLGGVLAILVPYVQMARTNARDYVATSRGEKATLHELEQFAAENGTDKVVVLVADVPVRDWNPYHVHYWLGDGHMPAFCRPWVTPGFLLRHSTLQLVMDPAIQAEALRQCLALNLPPDRQFVKVQGQDVVAVCPP